MMKKSMLVGIIVTLLIVTAAACTRTAPVAPTVTVTAPAPAPPIVIRFHHVQTQAAASLWEEFWAAEVEERTGGRVEIEMTWASPVVKAPEYFEAVRDGVFDMGPLISAYAPAKAPTFSIMELPSTTGNSWAAAKTWEELAKHPSVLYDLDRWNAVYLFPFMVLENQLMTVKPVNTFEDLDGLKMRCAGLWCQALENFGAVPIAIPAGEVYESMKSGIVEGGHSVISGFRADGIHEVAKYFVVIDFGNWGAPVVINEDTWNELPADVQKVMRDVSSEYIDVQTDAFAGQRDEWVGEFQDAGVTFIHFSDEDKQKVKEMSQPVWEKWVTDMDNKGYPGQEIFDAYWNALRKFEQERPAPAAKYPVE